MNISVIIATRNRSASLRCVLRELAQQVTEGRFTYEVIVIDNHSTDDTKAVVEALRLQYRVPLRYAIESQQGKAHALNAGLRMASGEIIAFTDDDTVVGPTWLATLHQTFEQYAADGVGGSVRPQWIGARPAWLGDRLLRQLGMVDYGLSSFVVSSITTTLIGPNCAYRASLFACHGGYRSDPGCAEDADWFRRVYRAGHRLVYQPQAVVFHKIDGAHLSPRVIARRFYRHGQSCAMGLQAQDHPRMVCRVPLWIVRSHIELYGQAVWYWLKGNRQEAMYRWLRRYFYWGVIVNCVRDWVQRRPIVPQTVPLMQQES